MDKLSVPVVMRVSILGKPLAVVRSQPGSTHTNCVDQVKLFWLSGAPAKYGS